MPSILPNYEYDIFISYRQNDNKRDKWVTQFVGALKDELEATLKNPVSIYFDENPHDGLLETHDVDRSLEKKLKCLIFIPIISQTYCDATCFAWEHELLPFVESANNDELGMNITLANGNVASRILPIRIHDIDIEDSSLFESVIDGKLRPIDFIYKTKGVNRPLKPIIDDVNTNEYHTVYRNQINKVANAIKEIINGLKGESPYSGTAGPFNVLTDSDVSSKSKGGSILITTPKILLSSLIVFIIIFVGAYYLYNRSGPQSHEKTSNSVIAVFPFSFRGGDEFLYLSEGMVNLLNTKLDGAGDLRCIDSHSLLRYLKRDKNIINNSESIKITAKKFGAGIYILGDIIQAGNKIQVIATAYDTGDGNEIVSASVDGDISQFFRLVDDISAQMLASLYEKSESRVQQIASVTTSSLQAYKDYLQGEKALRDGQFQLAVDAFQNAVAKDSLFALAYYRLSTAAQWNIQGDLSQQAAEKALQFGYRLSNRDKQLLEAFRVRSTGNNAEAAKLYRTILESYPNDMEVWLDLGEVLFHANPLRGRSFTESREVLERILSYDPDNWASLIHLTRIAAYENKPVELDSLVSKFILLNPQESRRLELVALQAFFNRQNESVILEELSNASDLSCALGVWNIAVFAKNIPGAIKIARMLADEKRSIEGRTLAHAWLAHLHLATGHWKKALDELDTLELFNPGVALEYKALISSLPFLPTDAANLNRTTNLLEKFDRSQIPMSASSITVFNAHDHLHELIQNYFLGILNARSGNSEVALKLADQLVQLPESPGSHGTLATDLVLSIKAQISIAQGSSSDALKYLEQTRTYTWYGQTMASPFYCQAYERFTRAELLFELGKNNEALNWYESLTQTSTFELIYLPISHLRRGEIYEKLGDNEKAQYHYSQFIELWKNCDIELQPMVQKAVEQLKALS